MSELLTIAVDLEAIARRLHELARAEPKFVVGDILGIAANACAIAAAHIRRADRLR